MRKLSLMMMPVVAMSMVFVCAAQAQTRNPLKVFISVDMEGIAGLVNNEETSSTGRDYEYFRRLMTREANSAIEGAKAAGATDIVVRDGHGSARNILPDLLDKDVRLLRDWSGGPKSMMEGIDETFSAVVFVGYHAKAGTPNAIIKHTETGNVLDLSINGVSLPESGLNGLIAGAYDVPVVFVAGDKAVCEQSKALFGEVETVAVKEGIGAASLGLSPELAYQKIRAGVEKALRNVGAYKPYKMKPPYTMVVKLKQEPMVYKASLFPGVKRTGDWEVTYTTDKIMDAVFMFEVVILGQ